MDLNAPIGKHTSKRTPKRSGRRALLAVLLVAIVGALGGAALLVWTADPRSGEPYAVASIPAPPEPRASVPPTTDATPTGSIRAGEVGDSVRIEHGVRVVSPAPTRTTQTGAGPAVIDVSRAIDEAARRSDASKASRSSDQALALNEDGAPSSAGPSRTAARPRIAIFIGGMGLDPGATRTATEIMPQAVDLAFLPGPSDPSNAVAAARARGHEILLQLPMQTMLSAPARAHMLRPDEKPSELSEDLEWMMHRFSGYAGVANLLGAPVMSRQDTMSAILSAVGKRGLFFVDDGTTRESGTAALSARLGIAAARADVVLDATADPSIVKANLAKLASLARSQGSAIGMASGLPDHLAAIASFANDARSQGLELVPVSAVIGNTAHLATSR